MNIQAVIFDLDGTLVNTLDDIAHLMNSVLERFGLPTHDHPAYRQFVGDGMSKLVERVIPPDQPELFTPVRDAYFPLLIEHGADRAQLYDGMAELLDELTDRGVAIAVCTNKPQDSANTVVQRLLKRWPFTTVIGQTDDVPRKPAPDMALACADRCGAEPQHALFVGDTHVDVETAIAAGMHAVGVTWGFRDRDELQTAGAQTIIDHPSELMSLFDTAQ